MTTIGTLSSSSMSSMTESMRKFSFSTKTRKGSVSSRNGGSSATNESVSNSSRPSVADSGRRKSSFASLSSRLRKAKRNISDEIQEQDDECESLGKRFCELPAEIQTEVLAYLNVAEILALRRVSKQCLAIIQGNASIITRNLLAFEGIEEDASTTFLLDLYPPLFASSESDAYLLRMLRRTGLIRRQLKVLLTFCQHRTYMLRLARDLPCENFMAYKRGLHARFYQPLGLMQHLLEIVRYLIIHVHPSHLSPRLTLDLCPACMAILSQTVNSYPTDQLLPLYQTTQLIVQNFRTAIKTPSLVTPLERKLRGWSYGPPPEEHMSQLMLLGCLPELHKMDEMQGSYSKRLNLVKSFCDKINESVGYNHASIEDFYQTETDPVMGSKRSTKLQPDVRLGLEASADDAKWGVTGSLDLDLNLITEEMLKSVPRLDKILIGQSTLLGKRIKALDLLVYEQELITPYEYLRKMLADSYDERDDRSAQAQMDDGSEEVH